MPMVITNRKRTAIATTSDHRQVSISWAGLLPILGLGGLLGGLILREKAHGRDVVFWLLVLTICGSLAGIAAYRVWRYRLRFRLPHLFAFQFVLLTVVLLGSFFGAHGVVWPVLAITNILYLRLCPPSRIQPSP
jgi:hypothetical protein